MSQTAAGLLQAFVVAFVVAVVLAVLAILAWVLFVWLAMRGANGAVNWYADYWQRVGDLFAQGGQQP